MSVENTDGVVLQIEEFFVFDPVLGTGTDMETRIDETPDSFVDASVSIGFIAALPGIETAVQVTLNVERTGYEDGSFEMLVQFDGKAITLSGNSVDEVLTVTNQDGVVAIMAEDSVSGLVTGSITVDSEEVATIEERDDGVVIIRYSDGTFETFA